MIRRPPRSTLDRSSAASDVYKRQNKDLVIDDGEMKLVKRIFRMKKKGLSTYAIAKILSLIHISEPTRPY